MTSPSLAARSEDQALPPRPTSGFRGDIDGLRALSILLVVGFHADVGFLAGGFVGVDVFFVISGYLITRNLLDESQRSGRVRVVAFSAKRLRRLVPALALMVVGTLALSTLVMARVRWSELAREGGAAALYLSNVLFARDAEDYFASEIEESPFLHTWSLGIEEQFYLLWPLVVLAACLAVRRHPHRLRPALGAVFSVILVTSFATCVALASQGSSWAFFGLHARAWEFAAAGLLAAVGPPRLLRRLGVRAVAALGGLGLVAWATLTFSAETVYPGWWAWVPVLGALLLVASGDPTLGEPAGAGAGASAGTMVSRALAVGPMQWLGRLSYSWYLWHWPAIILAVAWVGRDALDVRLLAAAASLPVAAAAHHLVEKPLRFSPRLQVSAGRSFAMAGVVTLVVLAAAAGLDRGATVGDDALQERLMEARDDRRQSTCAVPTQSPDGIDYCADGDLDGDELVMLLGDSHARHWKTATAAAAHESGVRLADRWLGACPTIDVPILRESNDTVDACHAHRDQTWALIEQLEPDAVILAQGHGYGAVSDGAGGRLDAEDAARRWARAMEEFLDHLDSRDIEVAVILDNPRFDEDVVECMSAAGAIEPCERSRAELLENTAELRQAELQVLARFPDVAVLDGFDLVCDGEHCPLEHDGDIAYADSNHLTEAFTMDQRDHLRSLIGAVVP